MTVRGFAGRKTGGRRVLNGRTSGQPGKHELHPGVWLDTSTVYILNGSIHPLPETLRRQHERVVRQ